MVVILKAMVHYYPNPFAGVGVVMPLGLSTLVLEASGFYVLPCTLVDHGTVRGSLVLIQGLPITWYSALLYY